MKRRIGQIVNAAIIWFGLAGLMIAASVVVGAAVPAIETAYMPVVKGWRAEATRELGGQTVLRIHGAKVRACKYLGEDIQVIPPDVEASDAASAWLDDPTPGSTRHPGRQDFGRLRVFTARETPTGSKIVGFARHACHLPWETITRIGDPDDCVTVPPSGVMPAGKTPCGFIVPPPPDDPKM